MTRSKRKQKKPQRRSPQPSNEVAFDLLFWLLQLAVPALLACRLLIPTEGTIEGSTLWLVQLWLAAGLLWAWRCLREGEFRIRLDGLDLAVWLIVAGHVISALAVVLGEGQKRAAINMLWEWVGLGVSFFLIRQAVRTRTDAHRLLRGMLAIVVAVACLGIWQHYVEFPQMSEKYTRLLAEWDQLRASPVPNQERTRELMIELQGVPLNEPERQLWNQRLKSSSEPLGLFALANTLAGLLAVWLIIGLGIAAQCFKRTPQVGSRVVVGVMVATIAFCLVLTKSRTGWVGLGAGLFVLGWLRLRRERRDSLPWLKWTVAAVVAVVLMLAAAGLSGGFDREVISEAPKSLAYRLQYWSSTVQVIRERPLLGTGPGNFRQHYLKYKLPESSEEIADPHNFVLDLWTSGGLLAVLGMAAAFFAALRVFGRTTKHPPTSEDSDGTEQTHRNPIELGLGLGFVLVMVANWFAGNAFDLRIPILWFVWFATSQLLKRATTAERIPADCLAVASIALLVHLLGAGGIEMPAVSQTLLLLAAVAGVLNVGNSRFVQIESRRAIIALGFLGLLLFGCCFVTATFPVVNRMAFVNAGDAAMTPDRDPRRARPLYALAATKDPLSPEPARRLAELAFDDWRLAPIATGVTFERAVELQQIAIELDPVNPNGYQQLGSRYLLKFARSGKPADARSAVSCFSDAVARYPNNAKLRAQLAGALSAAGQHTAAEREAKKALKLDGINHDEGHRDKFLGQDTLDSLKMLRIQPKSN